MSASTEFEVNSETGMEHHEQVGLILVIVSNSKAPYIVTISESYESHDN